MIQNRSISRVACLTSYLSFFFLIIVGVITAVNEGSSPEPLSSDSVASQISNWLAWALVISLVVLYVDAWLKLVVGWQKRTDITNWMLAGFLIIGTIIASYVFYYAVSNQKIGRRRGQPRNIE